MQIINYEIFNYALAVLFYHKKIIWAKLFDYIFLCYISILNIFKYLKTKKIECRWRCYKMRYDSDFIGYQIYTYIDVERTSGLYLLYFHLYCHHFSTIENLNGAREQLITIAYPTSKYLTFFHDILLYYVMFICIVFFILCEAHIL